MAILELLTGLQIGVKLELAWSSAMLHQSECQQVDFLGFFCYRLDAMNESHKICHFWDFFGLFLLQIHLCYVLNVNVNQQCECEWVLFLNVNVNVKGCFYSERQCEWVLFSECSVNLQCECERLQPVDLTLHIYNCWPVQSQEVVMSICSHVISI